MNYFNEVSVLSFDDYLTDYEKCFKCQVFYWLIFKSEFWVKLL